MKRRFLHIIFLMLMSLAATRAVAQGDSKWGMGVPFFENYAASKYKAHNRNFDVLCDEQGHVFFANFEGLLAYNQAEWQVIHTPGISRIVDLEVGKDGKVWFTGEKDELAEKYAVLKGGNDDVPDALRDKCIGFHAYRNGFEALIPTDDLAGIPSSLEYEKASIDEILVYIAKEDKNERHS
jgi:hypothetical protein